MYFRNENNNQKFFIIVNFWTVFKDIIVLWPALLTRRIRKYHNFLTLFLTTSIGQWKRQVFKKTSLKYWSLFSIIHYLITHLLLNKLDCDVISGITTCRMARSCKNWQILLSILSKSNRNLLLDVLSCSRMF